MGIETKIEWCDASWSPWRGCTPVSPACDHCYAARRAKWVGEDFSKIKISKTFYDPVKWKKPKRIFVGHLTDFFHSEVCESALQDDACTVIAESPQHIFMILTKRPENIRSLIDRWPSWPLPNVWLGVTVENQEQADKRIPLLLDIPAAKRFISVEPMLGPIDLTRLNGNMNSLKGWYLQGQTELQKLDGVICGGESGPGARPMYPDNPRSLRDQCQAAGVPFFFKQWGEYTPYVPFKDLLNRYPKNAIYALDGEMIKVGKKEAGRLLDGREWNEIP